MPDLAPPALEASGVTFSFGRRPVLRDVAVTARAGEIVALLGPNGCGKSTLLRVLLGQLRGAGSIRWEGRDVKNWGTREFARRVAFLPQQPAYTPGQTVLQSVALGRYPHLGMLGLESAHDELIARNNAIALGLETELNRPVDNLSGGQRQRVFIARCLAQEPAALLLDEPDTYLDLRHSAILASILRRLAREHGLTVLLASHDLHLAAALADRVLLMNDGQVVAEGPPRAVLTRENVGNVYGVRSILWESGPSWGVGVIY